MEDVLDQQMRREVLATLRAEGVQARWRTLHVREHELLQQMERGGLIERVAGVEPSARFTYRIRPL